jgi:hypothetical protein
VISAASLVLRRAAAVWKITILLVLVGVLTAAPLAYLLVYAMLH